MELGADMTGGVPFLLAGQFHQCGSLNGGQGGRPLHHLSLGKWYNSFETLTEEFDFIGREVRLVLGVEIRIHRLAQQLLAGRNSMVWLARGS